MDKKIFPFEQEEIEKGKVYYDESVILVERFITYPEKIVLINDFLKGYFEPNAEYKGTDITNYDFLGAKYSLILKITDMKTNIEIKGDENFDIERFLQSGVWEKIKKEILNYDDFMGELERVVSDVKEELILKKSLGEALENISSVLISTIQNVGGNLKNMDLEKFKETGKELLSQMENSPISSVFKESSQEANNLNARKTKKKTLSSKCPKCKKQLQIRYSSTVYHDDFGEPQNKMEEIICCSSRDYTEIIHKDTLKNKKRTFKRHKFNLDDYE